MSGAIQDSMQPPPSATSSLPGGESSLQLKWPRDLREMGLTELDARIIEMGISCKGDLLDEDRAGGENCITLKHGTSSVTRGGKKFPLPRSLVLYHNRSLVLLKSGDKKPLSGGADQPVIKWAYNPESGEWFLKKRILSIAQGLLVGFIQNSASEFQKRGFAKVAHYDSSNGKSVYFEKVYPDTISKMYFKALAPDQPDLILSLDRLRDLQNALRAIHSLIYRPPSLQDVTDGRTHENEHGSRCYHGDIAPQNIVCEPDPETPGAFAFSFIDWGNFVKLQTLQYTPGWGSPEFMRFLASKQITPISKIVFNRKYGREKDTWAFGLLAGSLLQGGFFFHSGTGICFPKFSFIFDKIKFGDKGQVDDSGIAELKQEEVDAKIQEIVKDLDQTTSIGRNIATWWKVIGMWLQVDPDKRPTLADAFISEKK